MITAALILVVLQQAPVALSISYSDGRIARHIITARPTNAWTPYFPKAAEWRSPEGLPVVAINYWHSLEDDGVRVKISLFLGPSHQREIEIGSVVVTRDHPVRVAAVERYGLEPVVLSLSEFEPRALAPPQVENKTASLHIESVEMSGGTRPGYEVRIRNQALKPVLTFYLDSFRDGKSALSSRRGERDGRPIVAAGEAHTFFLPTEHPLDLVRITGLMFEDGTIEGDASGVATTRVTYLGRRLVLGEVVSIFRDAEREDVASPKAVLATLMAQVNALPVTPDSRARQMAAGLLPPQGSSTSSPPLDSTLASAMADTRRGVLSDLKDAPVGREAFSTWLRKLTAQYETWYHRFIQLTAR